MYCWMLVEMSKSVRTILDFDEALLIFNSRFWLLRQAYRAAQQACNYGRNPILDGS